MGQACNAAWLRHRAGFAGSAAGYAAEAGQRRLVEPLRRRGHALRAEARELEPDDHPRTGAGLEARGMETVLRLDRDRTRRTKTASSWMRSTLVEQIADGDPAAIATAFPADAWPPEVYAEVLESLAREAASFRGAAARWGAESMSTTGDPVSEFQEAMARLGVAPKQPIQPDGRLHRFDVEGDREGSKNGFYTLHLDGRAAGAFGCWKRGIKETWKANGAQLSDFDHAKLMREIEAERKRREREEARAAQGGRRGRGSALARL